MARMTPSPQRGIPELRVGGDGDAPFARDVPGRTGMEGPRYIWRNFVSSSKERTEQAEEDWKSERFEPVPGEPEFIPCLSNDGSPTSAE
jgi:Pirin C-terminal cupin domain